MKNVYIFGGFSDKYWLRGCYKYDTKTRQWIVRASMNDCRRDATCTVFEGKIVLTGGYDGYNGLKSVEAYDFNENKWDILPA